MLAVQSRRRELIGAATAMSMLHAADSQAAAWNEVPRILARIKTPEFPKRDFDVTQYGSVQKAIDECSRAGGGRVVVPKGVFSTGPIRLKSNVNVHVPAGATLRFEQDPKLYLPPVATRFEGV